METIEKRDFNFAAKIVLGVSILFLILGIINNLMNYTAYSKFGNGISHGHLLIEALLNFFLIVAAILIYGKKSYGLFAFILLAIIRVFVTIPSGTDVSYSYYLGGKTLLFLRDCGLFLICLCFRKNGISGWHSFFASDKFIEATYKRNMVNGQSEKKEDVVICPSDDSPDLQVNHLAERDNSQTDNRLTNASWKKIVAIGAPILLVLLIIIMAQSCPHGASTSVNNEMANSLLDSLFECRPLSLLVVRGNNVDMVNGEDVFANRNDYRNCNIYKSGDVIKSKEDVKEDGLYINTVIYNREIKYSLLTGSDLIKYYDLIESDFSFNRNSLAIPFDIAAAADKEQVLMDRINNTPIDSIELIHLLRTYYQAIGNQTRLMDLFENNYKYNKNNLPFLYEYADVLINCDGSLDEAEKVAKIILKQNKNNPDALALMANVCRGRKEWEGAADFARRAIDYGSEKPDPYFLMAESMDKAGNKQEARRFYNIGCGKDGYSKYKDELVGLGGCPFDINYIEFAFVDYDGNIITNCGDRLYSSDSQFIAPYANVTFRRSVSDNDNDVLQCKLYEGDVLSSGNDSPEGYTYEWKNNVMGDSGMKLDIKIGSWGSPRQGNWSSGDYRFEIYYKDVLIGEETFHIY